MLDKKGVLKCKSCGYEWTPETINSHSIYYCPKCGMIGHLQKQFVLCEM